SKPVGRSTEDAARVARELVEHLREVLEGSRWRERLAAGRGEPRGYVNAALAVADWLRTPTTPGNNPPEGEESRADRFRRLAGRLARNWGLGAWSDTIHD